MKKLNFYLIITCLIGLFIYACADREEICTDDGCSDFNKDGDESIVIPIPEDDIRGNLDIEEWIENPAVVNLANRINLEYGVHKVVERTHRLPDIDTSTKDKFVQSLNGCINYLYQNIQPEHQIPSELIIAQAAIETGWGKSRFANEGNNLFGIRTWDKDEPYLLPIPWTKWPGWGVKMYSSKCESVVDYLHILNNVHAFEELREARANGVKDALELANYLDNYASKPTYVALVKEIIQYNLRGVYEL
jgi:Bax protein